MLRTARWIACIPLALLASVIVGAVGNYGTSLLGGSAWYAWVVSGGCSAIAFFATAFRVAPSPSARLKWLSVAIIVTLGVLSSVGALLAGRDRVSALAGMTMIVMALMMARQPTATLRIASEPTSTAA